ncbi:AbrB/MazE/SpoVT family DNA-binding domain-containing protein [Rossellomorea vietnamensis]|uniref:AbrB/MazE/SpoVT family DNA-binding domain-containing protein n=1 Tax=Rossellomorea vietnamensis TaxID=218284 RepID=A0A5D4MBS2_9BACI|nr:AbrB/MazE/SpoVT family DNA-binding domain-containing protein [Rossellomorea vietnamensis]TYR99061.1 AbrB/MazE/SpoVT family DNA-binding domain-containing protein [Rossellomorea vietnamensis]
MKSTGIIRKVDELGRIVIPSELRKTLEIEIKDPLEIFMDGEKIILQKYKPNMACFITGEVSDDNIKLPDSELIISRKGAEILIQELHKLLVTS